MLIMLEQTVKRILEAKVYDVAQETPLSPAPFLSSRLGQEVWLKREDLQPIFSFKVRGAYNMMANLSPAARQCGVITASAGNHAQGVALAAAKLGIKATIVMGTNTPDIKIRAVRARGAQVVLQGDSFDEARTYAERRMREEGLTWVPPYDHPLVIAGQGTVGMELLRQHPGPLDAIFVPVGGGGLLAGIAAYVKYLRPEIKVIGVESEGSACFAAARRAGRRVRLPFESLDLFADGVAVAQMGEHTWKLARRYVDDVVTVSTDEICAAIKDVFEDTRSLAEPAGALALAGLKKWAESAPRGQRLIAIHSGANVNFDRLRHVAERAEVGEAREAILSVTLPERPGAFRRFAKVLGKRAVTEFNYRYAQAGSAQVFVGLKTAERSDRPALVAQLQGAGYPVADLTDNEMAKVHVRHLVGGHRAEQIPEYLFRFEFPERPGALGQFLGVLGTRFNISLFHYRNHGAAWGRVLVAFQASERDRKALLAALHATGYRFWEESHNPAYEAFLA
jgi:threonine dehydratase